MKPIPNEAMPVVEILRRDVPRPKELPVINHSDLGDCLRWDGAYCPMGLHPKCTHAAPGMSSSFFTMNEGKYMFREQSLAFHKFLWWWDGLQTQDAQQAVNAIWPKEKP